MKWTTKQLTLCGVLTALALALSYMENLFPLTLAIPLPGVKLGLANIVTVFALYALGTAPAFLILIARCLLGAMFAGNMSALIFSLLGGVAERVRRVRGRRGGPQLRPGGRSGADPGQYGAAVLSAGAAGGIPADRSPDGAGQRLLVPGTGPYGSDERVNTWRTTTKRTRSFCSSWR